MELNKEELIELGFKHISWCDEWSYCINNIEICASLHSVIMYIEGESYKTNATTIQDIKDLIRLFK